MTVVCCGKNASIMTPLYENETVKFQKCYYVAHWCTDDCILIVFNYCCEYHAMFGLCRNNKCNRKEFSSPHTLVSSNVHYFPG